MHRVTFLSYFEPSKLLFECHECLDITRRFSISIFVCCLHLYKIVIIIVFIAFRYISIFKIFLPLPVSAENLSGLDNFLFVFLFFNICDYGFSSTSCIFTNSVAFTSLSVFFFNYVVFCFGSWKEILVIRIYSN